MSEAVQLLTGARGVLLSQQLVRCVESLERRRASSAEQAEQYRDQVDQSEQMSETLRMKLNDLEKSFAAMDGSLSKCETGKTTFR